MKANGEISKEQAIALASSNLEELLSIVSGDDMVAYKGGDVLSVSSKVGVMSAKRGEVDLF